MITECRFNIWTHQFNRQMAFMGIIDEALGKLGRQSMATTFRSDKNTLCDDAVRIAGNWRKADVADPFAIIIDSTDAMSMDLSDEMEQGRRLA